MKYFFFKFKNTYETYFKSFELKPIELNLTFKIYWTAAKSCFLHTLTQPVQMNSERFRVEFESRFPIPTCFPYWCNRAFRYHNGYCFHYKHYRKKILKIRLYFSWQNIRKKCNLLPISSADTIKWTSHTAFSQNI